MEILVDLIVADEPCPYTGIIYPKPVLVKAIEEFEVRIKRNAVIPGEHTPPPMELANTINQDHISHVVKHLWLQGNQVIAKLKLVGKFAELANAGLDYKGYLRAFYSRTSNDSPVAETCQIVTVDLQYQEEKDEN